VCRLGPQQVPQAIQGFENWESVNKMQLFARQRSRPQAPGWPRRLQEGDPFAERLHNGIGWTAGRSDGLDGQGWKSNSI